MNEMLLRGCMLKNSGYVMGLVVYTGRETRIQMNAAKTPLKVGAFRSGGGARGYAVAWGAGEGGSVGGQAQRLVVVAGGAAGVRWCSWPCSASSARHLAHALALTPPLAPCAPGPAPPQARSTASSTCRSRWSSSCSWPCACSAQWPTTSGSGARGARTTTWPWTCSWRATGRTRWPRSASPSSPSGSCCPIWCPSRCSSRWRSSSSGRCARAGRRGAVGVPRVLQAGMVRRCSAGARAGCHLSPCLAVGAAAVRCWHAPPSHRTRTVATHPSTHPHTALAPVRPSCPARQGFVFINFDRDMRDPKTREWARCRNSNLNEDLGKVGGRAGWVLVRPA